MDPDCFFDAVPRIQYADDLNREVINGLIGKLMDKGNKVTAINAGLRAVHVFLRCCFEQE